jgi:hypothetical protein
MTAPIGIAPLVSPLAQVMMSGVTSNSCAANGEPVRPKPVITSSKISSRPCFVADLAQSLEIPLGRQHHAGRARDGLDDDRGHGRCVVQQDQPLELVGQFRTVRG